MRWLWQAVAVLSLLLAIVGTLLPIMPTVPFVLAAAWAASKSSPRLARWMESHPRLGPPIRAWRQGGVVPRQVKWVTTATMTGGGVSAIVLVDPWWAAAVVAVMVAIAIWLWRRPEQAPEALSAGE